MNSFKNKVLKIVTQIPKGSVLSYKEVAISAGSPRAFRAVGNILNRNKDYKNVPCHRVVRSDGKIGGYNRGAQIKSTLLRAENVIVRSRKRGSLKL